jgi:hypothetical protein
MEIHYGAMEIQLGTIFCSLCFRFFPELWNNDDVSRAIVIVMMKMMDDEDDDDE